MIVASWKVAVAFGAGVVLTAGLMSLVRPSSFDDCVLSALKGNNSADNTAAALIAGACRRKFPFEAHDTTHEANLDPIELALLTGQANLKYGNTFGGTLYNGSRGTTVTEVEVTVEAITGKDTASRPYRAKVSIAPLSAAPFSVAIITGNPYSTYSWSISGARGFHDGISHAAPPSSISR